MRAASEGIRLLVAAAELWWRHLVPLVTVFLFGYGLHLSGLDLSVRIGSAHPVIATVVFVLAVLTMVGSLVVMLWLCRPPGDDETALDVVALTIGPFLAVYAVWGLVEEEVYALFAANIAVSGIGGVDAWSVNLQWIGLYVTMAAVAWVLRQVVGLLARRRPYRPILLFGALLEGVWTFASALAVLAGLDRLVEWVTSRAFWQGLVGGWHAFLGALPDLRLPFDLTLPEAVAELAGWLTATLIPSVWSAVLLPLVWVALTAVVFGRRRMDARTVVAGTALDTAHADLVARTGASRPGRLLHAGWLVLSSDLRLKYLPVLGAFRLLLTAGPWFLAAYLVLATALETARSWAVLGVARLLGARDQYVTLAWSWAEDLATTLPFTTAAVALYAAAGRRVLTLEVSEDGTPAGTFPRRPKVGP
ncbi:MAG TPA: hypothetical protein VEX66_11640 [Microlunatus sp.]|nr:hypothetical protein [Microlunatus sp.]